MLTAGKGRHQIDLHPFHLGLGTSVGYGQVEFFVAAQMLLHQRNKLFHYLSSTADLGNALELTI
ncbi:hypothetical protein SDC9_169441 [bioreactor metagenome]|uniref:Uncharacterized protein n=1 Tax=bioreactor metagenome TaxID=1076179 RepID=A0A645G5C4_9ZZZZ